MSEATTKKKSFTDRFLDVVEGICSKLPPPAILFCWLFLITAILGAIFTSTGVKMLNPATGKDVVSQNLFTAAGVKWFLDNMVKNFTGFAPLGLVLTMTLAIGFCEESGLLVAMLRGVLKNVPPAIVPYVIAFLGTMGNLASDTAMIVIPPLAAVVYIGVKKNPIAGMLVGYAGAQAGFSANLMIAGTDSLLQGLTNKAIEAFLGHNNYTIEVTSNWFFMMASTFLCAFVIGLVSILVIEPRIGPYNPPADVEPVKFDELVPIERKGLRISGVTVAIYIVILVIGYYSGLLSNKGQLVGSLLLSGLIPILFIFFSSAGISYGLATKKFKTAIDVNKAMVKQMSAMGAYVIFCFFCGQFQALFNWTQLGTMLAIKGADFLKSVQFTGRAMWVAFIIICALVNIIVSSGSAKWAILAPVFVPMFMLLGYHPGFTQLLYRLGDSPGNCFTPMSPYIWMILSVAQQKYNKDVNIGTLISNMIPVALVLQVAWIIFLLIWSIGYKLPIGPGVGYFLPAGIMP